MPEPNGVPEPDESQPPPTPEILYGNDSGDRTPWLLEFVRANFCEHFSTLYELLPPHAVEVAVRLTLQGISNDNPDDDDPNEEGGADDTQAPD